MLPIMLQSNIYVCWLTFEEYVAECWEMMMMEEEIAQAWKKEEMEGKDEFVQNKKMDKGKGNNKLWAFFQLIILFFKNIAVDVLSPYMSSKKPTPATCGGERVRYTSNLALRDGASVWPWASARGQPLCARAHGREWAFYWDLRLGNEKKKFFLVYLIGSESWGWWRCTKQVGWSVFINGRAQIGTFGREWRVQTRATSWREQGFHWTHALKFHLCRDIGRKDSTRPNWLDRLLESLIARKNGVRAKTLSALVNCWCNSRVWNQWASAPGNVPTSNVFVCHFIRMDRPKCAIYSDPWRNWVGKAGTWRNTVCKCFLVCLGEQRAKGIGWKSSGRILPTFVVHIVRNMIHAVVLP